jgi:hypothetical protein
MSLPKINTPEYRLTIPSTDEEITYRPFLVKEEKLLLIASETEDDDATYNAIRKIIESCCLTGDINLDKMPLFDMEYIFLNIRAKSVGEVAKLKVTCPDDEKTQVDIEVDLTKINVVMDKNHDARIQLTDNIGVLMSYPSMATVGIAAQMAKGKATDSLFETIANCLYQIWEGEEVHDAMDYTMKDKLAFIDSLNHEQFEKIQNFFETMPTLKHEVHITNPKTKKKSTVTLSGMNDFF